MDMQDWIKVGVMAAHHWSGVNAETAVQRCHCNSIVLPVIEPTLRFESLREQWVQPSREPIREEKVVLDALRLGSGHKIHIGYSERTNSLWINEG